MARILGLTGNIACGKTSVGRMLLELGAERYIDADALVHRLYSAGEPIALQVAKHFGPEVIAGDGSVDRKALGTLVFQQPEALRQLEEIVHPAVGVAMREELASVSSSGIAVIDAVKLLEGGSGALCQQKWLVVCSQEQALLRLMQRNHLSEQEAWTRIRAQGSIEEKKRLVDEVIDNSGTLAQTRQQVVTTFARFILEVPE